MKKAFTLVELLVVVVVMVTLMSLVFRLGSIAGESENMQKTLSRMQRIENCISGYYAAFGSYPPVEIHGSRDIYLKTNKYGIQQTDNEERDTSSLEWERVDAACRSQPFAMEFPFSQDYTDLIRVTSQYYTEQYNSGVGEYADNPLLANMIDNLKPGWIPPKMRKRWDDSQVFRFGLMSYLLPRFLVMMGNSQTEFYNGFAQWQDNNQLPCRIEDGAPYRSWDELNAQILRTPGMTQNAELWKIAALPSQAVTLRWLPNLEGILTCEHELTVNGIRVSVSGGWYKNLSVDNPNPRIYSAGNNQAGEGTGDGSTQYVLDRVTCMDGWKTEFYYYSDAPYQTYRFWSAGPNKRTFPPWISEEAIREDPTLNGNRNMIQNWRADDVVHMSN